MKSRKRHGLTVLTLLLLLLWAGNAHAHGLPLFLLPVVGAFLLFPLALLSALVGWLAKSLYYSDRTGQKSLSMIGWTDALKEAGLMYGCFILTAFVLDLGVALVVGWSRWWNLWGGSAILAVTTGLSTLATMFLHRRLLQSIKEAKDRESGQTAKPWSAVLLGLISPAIFSIAVYLLVSSRI